MGRSPCCSKEGLNRGAWTAVEDQILIDYIKAHGEGRWRNLPKKAGLKRCGKSCRLRWLNYLRPDIKRGNISHDEEELIIRLHRLLGNRWSLIAGRLPGRTDNEIKNYWNTNLGKKVQDNQNLASTRKHSSQSNEKNKKKPTIEPSTDTASPLLPKTESQLKTESHVVRTKAMRCSRAFINPQQHKIEHLDTTKVAGPSMVGDLSINKWVESGSYNGMSSFNHGEDYPSDFMIDVNVGELCLSDLLNSDFSEPCGFNYSTDNSNDLSTSSDQPLMFSEELMEDWTLRGCVQPNVVTDLHSFASFLGSGGDWL